uniref:Venom redulysin 10 n=1 Tax=Platymeris rhadamanthus TaxID=1134088 RepID=A0A6B9L3N6_PLARH|nr:venom redulysin 10 [Platymeris rhadamanthus]
MSKYWLLLLLLAAAHYVQSFPAEYEIDEEDYMSDEIEIDDFMSDELEIDNYMSDEFNEERGFNWGKVGSTLKKFGEKATTSIKKFGQQASSKLKTFGKVAGSGLKKFGKEAGSGLKKFGKKAELGLKKFGGQLAKGGKKFVKAMKKMKEPIKKLAKQGLEILKKFGVKIIPLHCEGKTCKSCIIFTIPAEISLCVQVTFLRTNKATYLIIALTKDDATLFEKRITMGDVSNCFKTNIDVIGDICLKGIEAHAESSEGQANVNFCLGVLAQKLGIGVKFCIVYANKQLSVKCEPTTFPGGLDENGDIVELDKNGEDVYELSADEFEVE